MRCAAAWRGVLTLCLVLPVSALAQDNILTANEIKAYQAWQAEDPSVPDVDCGGGCVSANPLPGAPPGLWAVTALGDADDDTHLGPVMAALVRQSGGQFRVVAAGQADGPESVGGTETGAEIDGAAYHAGPSRLALGVVVHEGYSTQSVSTDHATLYLFLQEGAALKPVFSTVVLDADNDLTGSGSDGDYEHVWSLRFSTHMTHGFYDLIVTRKGTSEKTLYRWDGARYRAA